MALEIMRPTTACLECRNGKRRCDRAGDSACSQCISRNIRCSAAAAPKQPSGPLSIKRSLPPILSPHTSNEHIYLVDLYFTFLHDKPHTLFHEPTFKASVAEGTVSQPVLLAMMGMSARYHITHILLGESRGRILIAGIGLPHNQTLLRVASCIVKRHVQH